MTVGNLVPTTGRRSVPGSWWREGGEAAPSAASRYSLVQPCTFADFTISPNVSVSMDQEAWLHGERDILRLRLALLPTPGGVRGMRLVKVRENRD